MHIFGEQNQRAGIASVSLLFIGLIGFRLIPVLKDEINTYFEKNEPNQSTNNESTNNEPNQSTNDRPNEKKLLNKTVDILQLAPEIDGWFTHFAALVLLQLNSSCAAIWIISVFIVILAACPIVLPALHIYKANQINPAEKFEFALYICMPIIVIFLLIGDNNQPLDCSISLTSNNYITGNIIRIIFSIFTVVISVALLIIAALVGRNNRTGTQ